MLYIRGEDTNWEAKDTHKFTREGNVYTLTLTSLNKKFKIADDGWTNVKHGAGTISTFGTYTFNSSSGDATASNLSNVKISFTLNKDNLAAELQVKFEEATAEPEPEPDPEPVVEYPTLYIRGNNTNWEARDSHKFTREGDVYTLTLPSLDGEFKIADANWGNVQHTYTDATISAAGTYTFKYNNTLGVNTKASGLKNVTISFTYNKSNPKGDLNVVFTQNATSVLGPSGTLPVLYINVYQVDANGAPVVDGEGKKVLNNEVIDKDLAHKNYFSGEYWLDVNNCQWLKDLGAASVGSASAPLPLEIKARGNYTRTGFAKKPFKLKLGAKQNLLNMNANGKTSKHWAILAHADDSYGYMRNFVGFRLGEMIGLPWTPRQQPVEVVINGDYRGLYFLTESIRVGDGRVPITELGDEVSDPALISGGYLVELDNYDEPEASQIQLDEKGQGLNGQEVDKLRVTFNTPELYSTLQRRFVNDQFTTMNDLIVANSDDLWKYMDMDDAARYYIVEEVVSHTESFHGSTYMFRDHGEGQKWHFSPLWDFGNAFNGSTNAYFYDCDPFGNTWIPSLRVNNTFNEKVKATFQWFINKAVDGSASPYERLQTEIDAYVSHIKDAALQDVKRWSGAQKPNSGNATDVVNNSDIETDKTNVKNRLNDKINWLKSQWGSAKLNEPARDTTEAAPLPDYAKEGDDPATYDIYIRGTDTNWEARDSHKFTCEGNVYTLTLESLDGEFKIADANWKNVQYTYTAATISAAGTYTFKYNTAEGNNTKASGLKNVTISFTYDKSNPQGDLTVVFTQNATPKPEPDPDPTAAYYVYFNNTGNWTQPYVHAWDTNNNDANCTDKGSWPGDAMTKLDNGLWYWELPNGKNVPTMIIFNNNNNTQTGNLTFVNKATYKADGSCAEPEPEPTPDLGPSGTLPVLYINVYQVDANTGKPVVDGEGKKVLNNEVIDKDLAHKNYFSGEYWLDVNNCQWLKDLGAASVGSASAPLPLEIKARGNYTRTGFAKKPFKLKLGAKQNLLNMNANGKTSKHWAILAHADDSYGYMRNFVGFRLGEMIGLPWTPRQQPVEVVINGDYRGLYFLTESIRVGDGRVPITELGDEVSDPALISGGYLIELDNYDEPEASQIQLEEKGQGLNGQEVDKLRVTFDTPELYSTLQRRFVTDQFTTMNDLIGENSDDLWKYMDLDDAARYYIVEEVVSHREAYHGSTYMYRERGEGQKWHFSPLWDFGNAFNGNTDAFFYNCDEYGNTWIPSLRVNNKFNEKVKATFQWFINKDVDGSASPYDRLQTEIDAYVSHIKAAALQDVKRWKGAPKPNSDNATDVVDNSDIDNDKTSVKNHLNSKINWLKGQWGSAELDEPARDTTEAAPLPDYAKEGYVPAKYDIYVVDDANWGGEIKMYAYIEGGSKLAEWPGVTMTYDANVTVNGHKGTYCYTLQEEYGNALVIFYKDDNNRYPGNDIRGLEVNKRNMVFYTSSNTFEEVTSLAYPWSTTLPLVKITTPEAAAIGYGDAGAVDNATFEIDGMGLAGVSDVSSATPGAVTIKGRGKSYWDTYDKKAYKLKFANKVAVLDMPKSKHWVLMPYANDAANGLLTNYAAHELSRLIGLEWTPKMKPVEVVLNGDYIGLYFIAENVRAAADRVQINDYGDTDDLGNLVYSEEDDFLLEFGSELTDDGTELFNSWTSADGFANNYITSTPAKEDIYKKITAAEGNEIATRINGYLDGYITTLCDAMAYAKAHPTSASWADVIDPEQAAKFYIVQEIMDDASSFADNYYIHHTTGSKWMMGPVWDFGNAFSSKGTKSKLIHEADGFKGTFIKDLYANRTFVWIVGYTFVKFVTGVAPSKTVARANGQRRMSMGDLYSSYAPEMAGTFGEVQSSIQAMADEIEDAVDSDAARWPQYAATSGDVSFRQRVSNLEANLTQSQTYLGTSVAEGGAGWTWSDITTDVEAATVDGDGEVEYFDVMGRKVAEPQGSGVYIVKCGSKVNKVLVK